MKIEFETDNAVFDDYGDDEIDRILNDIIMRIKHGFNGGTVLDINGNRIGFWKL